MNGGVEVLAPGLAAGLLIGWGVDLGVLSASLCMLSIMTLVSVSVSVSLVVGCCCWGSSDLSEVAIVLVYICKSEFW